jgi:hypothetical protein
MNDYTSRPLNERTMTDADKRSYDMRAMRDEIEQLRKEIAIAKYQAECIFKAHAQQCTLLPDLNGVLSQISNMTTGMVMKEELGKLQGELAMALLDRADSRNELERVKRQNSALRSYLLTVGHLNWCSGAGYPDCNCGRDAALKLDAGSDLLTREQVQPLVDALVDCERQLRFHPPSPHYDPEWQEAIRKAQNAVIGFARTIGMPVGVNAPVAATPDQFDNHPESETKDEQL